MAASLMACRQRDVAAAWEATASARNAAVEERQLLFEARAAAEASAADAMGSVAENLAADARKRKENETQVAQTVARCRKEADTRVAAAEQAAAQRVSEAEARALERVAVVEADAAQASRDAAAAAERRCKQQLEVQTQRAVAQVKELAAKEVARARAEVYSKAKEEVEQSLLWLGFPAAAAATATANLRHRDKKAADHGGTENIPPLGDGTKVPRASQQFDRTQFERFRVRSAPPSRSVPAAEEQDRRQAWSVSLFE